MKFPTRNHDISDSDGNKLSSNLNLATSTYSEYKNSFSDMSQSFSQKKYSWILKRSHEDAKANNKTTSRYVHFKNECLLKKIKDKNEQNQNQKENSLNLGFDFLSPNQDRLLRIMSSDPNHSLELSSSKEQYKPKSNCLTNENISFFSLNKLNGSINKSKDFI